MSIYREANQSANDLVKSGLIRKANRCGGHAIVVPDLFICVILDSPHRDHNFGKQGYLTVDK